VLALIALILFGIAVITVAAVVLLRPARGDRTEGAAIPDPEQAEREVYENLYGKRSEALSAPLPAKPPLEEPRPRTPRRSRSPDSHR
jgi:hypothetical protein